MTDPFQTSEKKTVEILRSKFITLERFHDVVYKRGKCEGNEEQEPEPVESGTTEYIDIDIYKRFSDYPDRHEYGLFMTIEQAHKLYEALTELLK